MVLDEVGQRVLALEEVGGDWLFNGNLYIGFLIMMSGFLGLLRWK